MPSPEDLEVIARAKKLRDLLDEFGAKLSGFDPGVTAHIKSKPPGMMGSSGAGAFGEHLSFNAIQWAWLEPLLEELRDFRHHRDLPAADKPEKPEKE